MKLTDLLDHIQHQTGSGDLKAGDVVESLNSRGYGPLLLAPALLTALPTGGIPGVPSVTAILIILIAGQILMGSSTPWIPQYLANRSIKKQTFDEACDQAKPYTRQIDRYLKPRLRILTNETATRIVAGICIVLALTMPPLEFVPFAAIVPAFAILFFALGISAQDGLLILIGLIAAAAGLGLIFMWWL